MRYLYKQFTQALPGESPAVVWERRVGGSGSISYAESVLLSLYCGPHCWLSVLITSSGSTHSCWRELCGSAGSE